MLDGALLSWFDGVDGKEEGFFHLSKVDHLVFGRTKKDDDCTFEIHLKDKVTELHLNAVSEQEGVSSPE